MNLQSNQSLLAFNTLRFESLAEHYVEAGNLAEIREAIALARQNDWPLFVLGGGSNIVLPSKLPGLTLRIRNQAITQSPPTTTDTNNNPAPPNITICAEAGVNWHEFVLTCIRLGAHGLENLSLIPGTVGAAPIQNIGAYGVELCDHFESLTAIDVENQDVVTLSRRDCEFGYRDSVFKQSARDRFVICSVSFSLLPNFSAQTEYRALKDELEKRGINNPDAKTVSQLVCEVRSTKLPDPAVLGNAGSFFKNPVLTDDQFQQVTSQWPDIPLYAQDNGRHKAAAGWMIEKAGWKGHQRGSVGVHAKQALVLTHQGGGNSQELLTLAEDIRTSVLEQFGVELEQEPRTV